MTPEERRSLDELTRRLAWVEWRLQWAEWKIGQLEKHTGIEPLPMPAQGAAPQEATARAPSAPTEPTAQPLPEPQRLVAEPQSPLLPEPPRAEPVETPMPPPRAAAPPAQGAPRPPFDWESLIGVRLLAWLGGAALFVAAALFLNYSIQQDLISPTLRVALGLTLGAGALVGGDRLRAKADLAGQALAGAGVATLYASLFAAHSLWHLIPSTVAFVGMALVTITAGALAVKRDAFMVAVLGLVGGFLTPYLVSTGEDRPLALFGYLALLDAGVVFVASRKRWSVLALLGVAGSALVFTGWALAFMDAAKAPYALFAGAALAGVFAFTSPDSAAGAGGKAAPIVRATASIAAVLPLVLAVVVAGTDSLPVAPGVLVAYLLFLSGGAWFAGRRVDVAPLTPTAAAFGALTLAVRADETLFPSQRLTTLAVFAVLPAAWFVLWLVRRRALRAAQAAGKPPPRSAGPRCGHGDRARGDARSSSSRASSSPTPRSVRPYRSALTSGGTWRSSWRWGPSSRSLASSSARSRCRPRRSSSCVSASGPRR